MTMTMMTMNTTALLLGFILIEAATVPAVVTASAVDTSADAADAAPLPVATAAATDSSTTTTTTTTGRQLQRQSRQLNSNNDLSAIWTIPEPSLSYSQTTNVLQLTWDINDIIEDTQLEFTFWDSDCQVGGGTTIPSTGTGYSITASLPSTVPVGDGQGTRQFKMDLSIQIPQITLNNNPKLYFNDEDRFKMCVRLGLSTPSSVLAQEVNWSETLIDLNFDLLNQGFSMNEAIDVYPPECKLFLCCCCCCCCFGYSFRFVSFRFVLFVLSAFVLYLTLFLDIHFTS